MNQQAPMHAQPSHAQAPEGCGRMLREAREHAGMAIEEAAGRLKMPARVLQAIEGEHWDRLGPPVFVRGQLRSYARLLKLDLEPLLERAHLQTVQPSVLVSRTHVPRYQRVLESLARRAVYFVLTAAIAVPVWVATQWDAQEADGARTASLDIDPPAAGGPSASALPATREQRAPAPVVASLAPAIPRAQVSGLVLRAEGESWIEVNARDGSSLEQGLMRAGDERSFASGEVGSVVLGNAAAVQVQHAGSTVDLAPYQRANVARFAVSSEGSLVPVSN